MSLEGGRKGGRGGEGSGGYGEGREFAIRRKYQVVRIEEFAHGVLHDRLLAGEVQYCYNGQQRA